ncbi:extracellular solute-binding protein [Bifidobacterium adolescentis]|uniref:extracellular solute-binding protein n=1 Tax=Bifidobacterium adolescentis TaxID=1680 RepID=UPI000ADD4864|nr:extracellular solute-binding protein [Bifidobacterium adolescentis]
MNRNITRIVAIAATLAMGTSLAACGGSSADSSKGHVYFMNNKAEVVDQYKELASMYTKKTGVQVDIQTGAAGTYDATMKSELAKDNAPTMFNVAGFDQFAKYQKYVEPLHRRVQTAQRYRQGLLVHHRRQFVHPAVRRRMVRHHLQQEDHQGLLRQKLCGDQVRR